MVARRKRRQEEERRLEAKKGGRRGVQEERGEEAREKGGSGYIAVILYFKGRQIKLTRVINSILALLRDRCSVFGFSLCSFLE
jgi:hypothetical protein